MKRKKSILVLSMATALLSLGAFAAGEIMHVGRIKTGEGHAQAPAKVDAAIYTVPVTFTPTQEQYDQCVTINNNPNTTWGSTGVYGAAFTISYNPNTDDPFDNWIILPAVEMQTGDFKFSCEYVTRAANESFQIYLLDAADVNESHRVKTLLDKEAYKNTNWVTEDIPFSIASTGNYYIALHASSPVMNHGICVRNLSIVSNNVTNPQVPAVKSYSVEGLEGMFEVQMPTTTLAGHDIEGALSLRMDVDGTEVKTVSTTPGATETLQHTFTSGTHEVSFTAISAGGESQPVTVSIDAKELAPIPLHVPFTLTPTRDEFSWCEVFDMNSDGYTWKYTNAGGSDCFGYSTNSGKRADDWLILPQIEITEPGMYILSFDVYTKVTGEALTIGFGKNNDIGTFYNNKIFEESSLSTSFKWENRTVKLSVSEAGIYYFGFLCSSKQRSGDLCLKNVSVTKGESGVPMAPVIESIESDGSSGTVNVKLPTTTFEGKTMSGTLTALLSIDGEETPVTASGEPGQIVALPFSELDKGQHTASVRVSRLFEGMTCYSEPVSQTFVITSPQSMRYKIPFALNLGEDFNDFTLVDRNDDGFTWQPAGNDIKYSYSALTGADEWLFTRPVAVTAADVAKLLEISVEAYVGLGSAPESFEIWMGSAAAPEAMTKKLIDAKEINNTSYSTFSSEFSLSEAGDYIIGIHANSPAARGYLYLANLSLIATSRSSLTPAQVSSLYADPDQTGALRATLTFDFPTLAANGQELDANAELTATAVCGGHTASTTGLPGQEGQIIVETAEGENTIIVYCSNDAGQGLAESVDVKCGLDRPVAPRILRTTVSEDNRSMTVQWRAVTTGENDGIVNAAGMRYQILSYDEQSEMWEQIDDTDKLTYTYTVPETASYLDTYYIGIRAYNAPESYSAKVSEANAVLGTPYELPMVEEFTGDQLHYGPVSLFSTLQGHYAPSWYIGNPADLNSSAVCADGAALIGHTEYSSGDSQVEFPKFSTMPVPSGENQVVDGFTATFNIYMSEYTPEISFVGYCFGRENAPVTVGSLNTSSGTGWTPVTFTLPEDLCNKQWVALRAVVNFTRGNFDWALIDSYKFEKQEHVGVDGLGVNLRGVVGGKGNITLKGFAGAEVRVVNLAGVTMAAITPDADQITISLPAGIYLVNTTGNTYKVIVR